MKDKLFKNTSVIIDANNVFISTYSVSTYSYNGEFYGGVLGFVNMLNKCLKSYNPNDMYIVWDGKNSRAKRQVINEEYKNHRTAPKPHQMVKNGLISSQEDIEANRNLQRNLLTEVLATLPFYNINLVDLEADDIISKLAQKFSHNNDKAIIISNDKDFYQLLDDNISIYRSTNKTLYTKEDLLRDVGIHPHNFVLARALEGDKSDNLPGLKGAGLATICKRFPGILKEKKLTFEELYSQAVVDNELDKRKKPYTIYTELFQNQDLVKKNYAIMQLYEVNMSSEENQQLKDIIECNRLFKESEFNNLCDIFANRNMMKNFKMLLSKYSEHSDYF